jgi:hypothetical protein
MMTASERADALEVTEDLRFQYRQWLVARIATGAFTVIAVIGILGLTGGGPLSHAQAESRGGEVSVDYDRFLRLAGHVELELQLESDRGAAEIVVDEAYLEGFDIENISPQPDSESADGRGLVFSFEEETRRTVSISLLAREVGFQRAEISASGLGSVSFRQFVYP